VLDDVERLRDRLGEFTVVEGRGPSMRLVFATFGAMDAATHVLSKDGIRYRSAKSLAPFRLTGNLEWGLPAPDLDQLKDLTFWVWPESLWAPISFTSHVLQARGEAADGWTRWWCDDACEVFQFIGEDNIFYYGLAEMALFLGMQGAEYTAHPPNGQLGLPRIVANRHLLFLNTKASSSSKARPPSARDLLDHYTPEQLRIHFLSLSLGARNANFRPKPLDADATKGGDPVLKDGNVLSNALNRVCRSCFYTAQKHFDRRLPAGEVSPEMSATAERALLDFEQAMHRLDLHVAVETAAEFVRFVTRHWSQTNPFYDDCAPDDRVRGFVDGVHGMRTAILLFHSIAPRGTELVRHYLDVGEELWSWGHAFEPLTHFLQDPASHRFRELPEKFDFFEKHASQID